MAELSSSDPLKISELFNSEFMSAIERLRMVAHRVAAGGRFAEQRSHDLGSGIEFRDYRPYSPGDELRSVDWNIYRRLGRVFIRLFEELEDLPLYLLVDVSKSSFMENPPRVHSALRSAMALGGIALGQHDSVGVFTFSNELQVLLKSTSGKNRTLRIAEVLSRVKPGGQTDLVRSLKKFESLNLRKGLVVLISDFFDPGGMEAVRQSVRSIKHSLLFLQLVKKDDRVPQLDGDLRLTDCETGDTQNVSVDESVKKRYAAAYDDFQDQFTQLAKRRSAGLLQVDCEEAIVDQLAELFEGGRYLV